MNKYILQTLFIIFFLQAIEVVGQNNAHTIWQIGIKDNSASEFALAPDKYEDFLKHDFEVNPENAKSIRYVRYRPIEAFAGEGAGAYNNLYEITFWGKNILPIE